MYLCRCAERDITTPQTNNARKTASRRRMKKERSPERSFFVYQNRVCRGASRCARQGFAQNSSGGCGHPPLRRNSNMHCRGRRLRCPVTDGANYAGGYGIRPYDVIRIRIVGDDAHIVPICTNFGGRGDPAPTILLSFMRCRGRVSRPVLDYSVSLWKPSGHRVSRWSNPAFLISSTASGKAQSMVSAAWVSAPRMTSPPISRSPRSRKSAG